MDRPSLRQRKVVAKENYDDRETEDYKKEETKGWWRAACMGLLAAVLLTPVVVMIIPSPIDPVHYTLPPRPMFEGALTQNTHLQKAERLFENEILGPESIVVDGEHMYTGTADGKIVHIHKGKLRVLAKLGKDPCGSFDDEPTCGRPLGMRLDKDGYLIVIDTYLGLFKVNVATGEFYNLWSSTEPVNGKRAVFLNDLTITKEGIMYITDSSTKWDRRHNRHLVMEAESTGRLLKFDPVSGSMTEAISGGIAFANGVQLTKDESAMLICETTKARLLKYHLKGPKKGELEIINDNLPGLPDNIRPSSSGGFWVGFALVRKPHKFSLSDFCADKPWLRSIIMKTIPVDAILSIIPKYGLLLEVDSNGKIVRSLHDPTGKVIPAISEVEDKDGVLYMGSYNLPYISRLFLRQIK